MSETTVCPVCGREYEPEYENREDAPPRSIGREQHQTGICSDECWDEWLGIATDGGAAPLQAGEFAEDTEQEPERRDTVVVVNRTDTVAREYEVSATGRTVYAHNQSYGYSPEAPVVEVVYTDDMDATMSHDWRDVNPDGYVELVRRCGVSTYSFPEPRLERAEDKGGERQ